MKRLITANKILELAFFKGLLTFIKDAQVALLVIEALALVLLIIWKLFQLQMVNASSDEGNESPRIKKQIKIILICGALIIGATAFVPGIMSYFEEGE